jgi:hypothetical protein
VVWFGYIEATKEIDNELEVLCTGMLGFFRKRAITTSTNYSGAGSTEAFGALTIANSKGATGITAGSGGVTGTKDITLDNMDVLSVWEKLAQAHQAEFHITDAGVFDFVSSLGSDKSSTVTLKFTRDGTPGTNLREIEIGSDGEKMANRVYGHSTAGGDYTYNNTASQDDYGDGVSKLILEEHVQFNEAQDAGTLQSMTEAYGSQVSYPITDFRVIPQSAVKRFNPISGTRSIQSTELQYGDVVVGDLVTLNVITDTMNAEETKRIAEINVSVDTELNETVSYTLSRAGVFITESFLNASEVDALKRRIALIESQI